MPLNYSKWDALELSDDSDIEVHPNVDKRSMIRWKQRDIHEKREQRKRELAALRKELSINDASLVPLLQEVVAKTKAEGKEYFSRKTAELKAGREARGNADGPDGPTAEDMVLSLLLQVAEEPAVSKAKASSESSELDAALTTSLEGHHAKLVQRTEEVRKTIADMEEEDAKKITSDNIRDGWSTSHIAKAEPETKPAAATPSSKGKEKSSSSSSTTIETLNSPSASGSSALTASSSSATNHDDDDDDDKVPDATEAMLEFAALPSALPPVPYTAQSVPGTFIPSRHLNTSAFEEAYRFLGAHRELLRETADGNTTDALLVEAFSAQQRGQKEKARKCVEKALLIQYCQKLGKDGVSLFFKRMTASDGKASIVFFNDVLSTYVRIATRCAELAKESPSSSGAGEEQIQLVAEDPSTVISFDVPDGPPPEHIELEGEGLEGVTVEQVREMLQKRWDIFQDFDDEFKQALQTKELDQVNKVLGKRKVEEAEQLVALLDQAGILSFSSTEIRDETGR